ncbi:MAG: aminotransferase class V-fold PLP-dependent enzyme [Candidatus Micrarchaeota archaeon]
MLLAPGPVPVLKEISEAQTKEMITHRSAEFSKVYSDLCTRLKGYFNAEVAYVLTGSGAVGLETLVLNLCEKNDKVVCFPNGEFGEKLVETFKVYANPEVHVLPKGGMGWNLAKAKQAIDNSNAKVFAIVYNETSYGVRNHIKEMCKYAKSKGMLTIIDAISAWPGTEVDMKEFDVDGIVTGSQKGIGAPAGMALIGLSAKAVEVFSSRKEIPSYCFDLRKHKKRFEKDQQTPNTPAVTLYWALQKAFDVMDAKGGTTQAVKRHHDASVHVRKRLVEMGFGLIAEKEFESNTVTGFVCNSPEQAKLIKSKLQSDYNIKIVGARGEFINNGLRIAHMGNFDIKDLDAALDAIGKIMK